MNEQGTFIATLLDHSGRALASSTVLRLQESGDDGQALVQELGFQALIGEVEGRIQVLAESLAAGHPELFAKDAQWSNAAHQARGISPALHPALLAHLKAELQESLPESDAPMAAKYVQAAIEREEEANTDGLTAATTVTHEDLRNRFLLATLEGNAQAAETLVIEALNADVPNHELHHHVLTPAQREIGEMWHRGDISVADEHLASRIVERTLAAIRARVTPAGGKKKTVLLASVSGNLHDIGLRIVADQFESHGWNPIFLGANMPKEDLATAVGTYAPDLVALSAGLTTHLRATANSIQALRTDNNQVPVIVGGGPFATIEDLWKSVGADACAATARAAVELGEKLTGA